MILLARANQSPTPDAEVRFITMLLILAMCIIIMRRERTTARYLGTSLRLCRDVLLLVIYRGLHEDLASLFPSSSQVQQEKSNALYSESSVSFNRALYSSAWTSLDKR